MAKIKPRPTQTKVKHTILRNYLKAWGGIIINGWRKNPATLHLVYIDCNASTGRYSGELEDSVADRAIEPIFGSPVIGIGVLDSLAKWASEEKGMHIHTNAILLEQEQEIFDELKKSLSMAGFSQRVRETDGFFSLQNSEIAVLRKDSTSMAQKLVEYTQSGFTFSFFALDPYGPKGIPLDFVGEIIRYPKHDVLINMPYYDLLKKSGIVPNPKQTSVSQKLLKNYDAMFGNTDWQVIVRELDTEAMREGQEALYADDLLSDRAIEASNLELELMNSYKTSLLTIDPDLTVKSIGLHFPDKERTMYYLYLTTHDPTGALVMNQVLADAGYLEHELRWKLMEVKKRGPQLALFEIPVPLPHVAQRKSVQEIAEQIRSLFRGRSITKKALYTALADEPYVVGEINKALTYLKRQNQASFGEDRGIHTRIKFI